MKYYEALFLSITLMGCASSNNGEYRNLALRHAAYQSSSSDYNLTAQLATDGIVDTRKPARLTMSTHQGEVTVNDREKLLDDNDVSKLQFDGSNISLQLDFFNMTPEADAIELRGMVSYDPNGAKGSEIVTLASSDGIQWEVIDQQNSKDLPGEPMNMPNWGRRGSAASNDNPSPVVFLYDYQAPSAEPEAPISRYDIPSRQVRTIKYGLPIDTTKHYSHYKVTMSMPTANYWEMSTWDFKKNGKSVSVLPATEFVSAWRSQTGGDEWIYVDMGAPAKFDKVSLHWINKAKKGEIQVSDDAENWKTVAQLPDTPTLIEEITLDKPAKGQYVRLNLDESADGNPYELSELQIWGTGGADHTSLAAEKSAKDNIGSGRWRLQRDSEVKSTPEQISLAGYDDSNWIPATVPGTVLTSLINIGAVPDPNFADNQLQISESYFMSDFWYRTEFECENLGEELSMLEFDGINWRANIYLNGKHIGDIDGAFHRGKFDVTEALQPGTNALAVKIIRNAHPGAVKEQTAYTADGNGGALGADNPTFHASIGWDWIPTIRGRNIGIWNDVRLTHNGGVTIEDPFVNARLNLPDTTVAYLTLSTKLHNRKDIPVSGTLQGKIGESDFAYHVELPANEQIELILTPEQVEALRIENPRLWWPKGYGAPNLYDVELKMVVDGNTTDTRQFKTGIRQVDFDESEYLPSGGIFQSSFGEAKPERLSLYINGRRFVGFGGNWGFSESNLNYRDRDYDTAVGYHADMNFTMIRNWVGQIGDEEFYDACDRHGVMVWQDFWLANPYDGPNPAYPEMFEDNALDFVRSIRNHPSIALYCGRNEGNPPTDLDNYLRKMVADEHPGIHYISHSAAGVVSGGGPYRALPPKEYFRLHGHDKMHSERGMPCVMNYEHLVRAMGSDKVENLNTIESPSDIYGLHDYTLNSAQSASSFNDLISQAFGTPKDAKQFAEWAQWINYNGYRAIFEGRSEHRRGMLLWMSHPAWPSMVWQTYDYYFEPTAAYFGCKKACEPLHIQWNPLRDDIEVVNYHAGNKQNLIASALLINQDGKQQWEREVTLNIDDDQTVACFPLEAPDSLSDTYFIKLTLKDAEGNIVSDNFYWRGKEENNFKSLLDVPSAKVDAKWDITKANGKTMLNGTVTNKSDVPAMMIRFKAVDKHGEMILPVVYSDNYIFLMPGETRDITITIDDRDLDTRTPKVDISYMND